jgi:hypothetical protein
VSELGTRIRRAKAKRALPEAAPLLSAAGSDLEQARGYARLRRVRWAPRMAASGDLGGRVGPDSPIFLRSDVVPLLRAEPDGLC